MQNILIIFLFSPEEPLVWTTFASLEPLFGDNVL